MDGYLTFDGRLANVTTGKSREDVLRWFDELSVPLRRYLICTGTTPADAEDAVQETFLRLHRHLQQGGDCANVCGWVFQVARNYIRDERKSARRQRSVQLQEAIATGEDPADPQASPESHMLGREQSRRLQAAILKLPEQQRECMLLRASGLRYREIANILGINISNVGALVHRALARLNEELV